MERLGAGSRNVLEDSECAEYKIGEHRLCISIMGNYRYGGIRCLGPGRTVLARGLRHVRSLASFALHSLLPCLVLSFILPYLLYATPLPFLLCPGEISGSSDSQLRRVFLANVTRHVYNARECGIWKCTIGNCKRISNILLRERATWQLFLIS